jgi:hypothetical protein
MAIGGKKFERFLIRKHGIRYQDGTLLVNRQEETGNRSIAAAQAGPGRGFKLHPW